MNWRDEYKKLLWLIGLFLLAWFLPVGQPRFDEAVDASLSLTRWYAREHVLFCLVPAFFIAGVIAVFVNQAAVVKYFGAGANKWLSYSVAAVSGTVLAVCSCTVLPLFSSIYKRGAGLGPAVAFLYSGPAISALAIILTARVLGLELGLARTVGAVGFSIVIGLIMSLIYRREEAGKVAMQLHAPELPDERPLWQTAGHFFILVAILVFANWGRPDTTDGLWAFIFGHKWAITGLLGLALAASLIYVLRLPPLRVGLAALPVILAAFIFPTLPLIPFTTAIVTISILLSFAHDEAQAWLNATWDFAKQIMPLLAMGVLASGFLLGSPEGPSTALRTGHAGLIPNEWIARLVGGNSLFANFFAAIVGAFMYFATLTEVPIVQGLLNSGMGKGPALALLLAGPALSLPSMLVIRSVMGTEKTVVYVTLVVVMATISGMVFGAMF